MADLVIRSVEPRLKEDIEERARAHGRSPSEEAEILLRRGLSAPEPARRIGSEIAGLIPEADRTEEPVFEIDAPLPDPPDFR